MENNRGRGRLPVPVKEKKVRVSIWVKAKDYAKATRDCQTVAIKYNKV